MSFTGVYVIDVEYIHKYLILIINELLNLRIYLLICSRIYIYYNRYTLFTSIKLLSLTKRGNEREVASILLGKGKGGEGEEIEKGQIVKKRKEKRKVSWFDSPWESLPCITTTNSLYIIYIIQIQYLIRSFESDSHFE